MIWIFDIDRVIESVVFFVIDTKKTLIYEVRLWSKLQRGRFKEMKVSTFRSERGKVDESRRQSERFWAHFDSHGSKGTILPECDWPWS